MDIYPVQSRPNVAFAGLTAAGKTTHAKLLAEALGYEYISATDVLMDVLGMRRSESRTVWFTHLDAIHSMRESDEVDDELERRLIKIAGDNDGLVLDTWALPWICQLPMVRLWMESDELSRTWKCFLSQEKDVNISCDMSTCGRLVHKKDQETRKIFLRRHRFDLFSDRTVFDLILSNTDLIAAPTRQAADRGIAKFAPVVLQVCLYALDRSDRLKPTEVMSQLSEEQQQCIVKMTRFHRG